MLKEFKEFAIKGNAIDMAVGIIIGVAFGKVIDSMVNDIILPPIGMLLGKVDFSSLAVIIQKKTAVHPVISINYGKFINNIIDFTILSFSIFVVIYNMKKIMPKKRVSTKACPDCFSDIHKKATRCPHCTATIK